jgi:hypothetical protein
VSELFGRMVARRYAGKLFGRNDNCVEEPTLIGARRIAICRRLIAAVCRSGDE